MRFKGYKDNEEIKSVEFLESYHADFAVITLVNGQVLLATMENSFSEEEWKLVLQQMLADDTRNRTNVHALMVKQEDLPVVELE